MYGVSEELPFASYIGEECNSIGLGKYQVQFHFSGGRKSIDVESKWELRDADGDIIDQAMPQELREAYRVHHIIEHTVQGYKVDPPTSFTLQFDNGFALTIYDDEDQYECFSLHTDGRSYYV